MEVKFNIKTKTGDSIQEKSLKIKDEILNYEEVLWLYELITNKISLGKIKSNK